MSTRSEQDNWRHDGPNILAPEWLALIRETLEQSPVIVEHWFYRGSRSPERLVFDDFDRFDEYLRSRAQQGDAIYLWRFDHLCRDENVLVHGKYPDQSGLTPVGGAY
jgi:hypothetical protein